jgi:hypothetical protein
MDNLRLVPVLRRAQEPCTIARVSLDGDQWFAIRQVWETLFDGTAWSSYLSALKKVSSPVIRPASKEVRRLLWKVGAIKPRASKIKVATHGTIYRCMQHVGLEPVTLESFLQAKDSLGLEVNPQPSPQPQHAAPLIPTHMPLYESASASAVYPTLQLPATLPQLEFNWPKGKQYGLKAVAPLLMERAPLSTQLSRLQEWCTADIDLTRSGRQICARTWGNLLDTIVLYLGFIYSIKLITAPTLEYFLDSTLFMEYIAFHKQKGTGVNTIYQTISAAIKVVTYFRARGVGWDKCTAIINWMATLRAQMKAAMGPSKKRDSMQLEEAGQWVEASKLVSLLEKFLEHATASLSGAPSKSPELARLCHDALLGCMMFGWIPPMRASCVMSMVVPLYMGACAMGGECKEGVACLGNQIVVKGGDYQIDLPHHKNAKHWGKHITFHMPLELQGLLNEHLQWGQKVCLVRFSNSVAL